MLKLERSFGGLSALSRLSVRPSSPSSSASSNPGCKFSSYASRTIQALLQPRGLGSGRSPHEQHAAQGCCIAALLIPKPVIAGASTAEASALAWSNHRPSMSEQSEHLVKGTELQPQHSLVCVRLSKRPTSLSVLQVPTSRTGTRLDRRRRTDEGPPRSIRLGQCQLLAEAWQARRRVSG